MPHPGGSGIGTGNSVPAVQDDDVGGDSSEDMDIEGVESGGGRGGAASAASWMRFGTDIESHDFIGTPLPPRKRFPEASQETERDDSSDGGGGNGHSLASGATQQAAAAAAFETEIQAVERGRQSTGRTAIFMLFDEPESSFAAAAIAGYIMLLIFLGSITFVLETVPSINKNDDVVVVRMRHADSCFTHHSFRLCGIRSPHRLPPLPH